MLIQEALARLSCCVHRVQAEAVTAQEKTLIILNPLLKDVPSSDGVMGVRQVYILLRKECYIRDIYCMYLPAPGSVAAGSPC